MFSHVDTRGSGETITYIIFDIILCMLHELCGHVDLPVPVRVSHSSSAAVSALVKASFSPTAKLTANMSVTQF